METQSILETIKAAKEKLRNLGPVAVGIVCRPELLKSAQEMYRAKELKGLGMYLLSIPIMQDSEMVEDSKVYYDRDEWFKKVAELALREKEND